MSNKPTKIVISIFTLIVTVVLAAACAPTTESDTSQIATEVQAEGTVVAMVDATSSVTTTPIELPTELPTSRPEPTEAPTNTPAPTETPTAVPTNTPLPEIYSAALTVCHDLNGDASCGDAEPRLQGIGIDAGVGMCTSNEQGICVIEGLEGGVHRAEISAPERFRHLFNTPRYPALDLGRGIGLKMDGGDREIDVALAEGRYLLPFSLAPDSNDYIVYSWYDRVIGEGLVSNWTGAEDDVAVYTSSRMGHSDKIDVEDEHRAVDFFFTNTVDVLAPESGKIITIEYDSSSPEVEGYIIELRTDEGFVFNMGHVLPTKDENSELTLKVGDRLSRGEKIGTSTPRPPAYISAVLPGYPHILHFGLYHEDNRGSENYIDPYGERVFVDSLELGDDLPVIE